MDPTIFFNGWNGIVRILLVGPAAYIALIFLLRISGKRTLSKMNAFDLVVTISFGSTLASTLLSKSVSLAEGVLALGLLVLLQFVITWLSVRSEKFQGLVKSEPSLLVSDGAYLESAMRAQRVTHEEIQAAARENGATSLSQVKAVILETNGSLTVVQQPVG